MLAMFAKKSVQSFWKAATWSKHLYTVLSIPSGSKLGNVPDARMFRICGQYAPPAALSLSVAIDGRISDLLKFLVPKIGESFVLGHNVESQEVAQARPRPELAGALETILELAAL